jgi:hypothetical protein
VARSGGGARPDRVDPQLLCQLMAELVAIHEWVVPVPVPRNRALDGAFSLQKCVYTQFRCTKVVRSGIAAEVRLVFLAGVVTSVALAVGAPSATAALPQAPAAPAAPATATAAVGAVQQQAAKGVAAAQQATSDVQRSVESAVEKAPRIDAPRVEAPRVNPAKVSPPHVAPPRAPAVPRVTLPAPPAPAASAIGAVGRETSAYRQKLVPHLSDAQRAKPVGDVLTLVGNALGNTLRQLAPQVGSLLAPVQPLLADLRGGFDLPHLDAVVTPGEAHTLGATAERGAVPPAAPPAPAAVPPTPAGAHAAPPDTFQAASARPPAAEVGGRPVSLPPRTAPAPVAGGAAPSSTGGFFVPFLGLLVLAALAAPRLLRRLDELPAFVRPEPFLCALERPG